MLAVWLYGQRVATIERAKRARLRLTYSETALEEYRLGVPLLSMSMPLRPEPYTHGVVQPFVDGILPEDPARTVLAREHDVSADDSLGLLAALGRDCAGALIIQSDNEPPPPISTTTTAEPLDEDALVSAVSNLRSAPLGAIGRVRVSLGGVQEKLLLTRMPDGRWGRPVDGTPSTHILKPEIASYPHTVANEAYCMRLARELGLPVAVVDVTVVGGRKLLVVERFDREVSINGTVRRIHQEDLCQALGVSPRLKYEEEHGPSLRGVAQVVQATTDSLDTLLRAVVFNLAIGNGDAHAKNFSLLHMPDGSLRLAPLYDLMSTMIYNDDRLAMYIDDVRRMNRITGLRLQNEAERWGISRPDSRTLIDDLLARLPDAAKRARTDTPDTPEAIATVIEDQSARLRTDLS